ncbi:Hypothetical predicted protein [Scomber scombrus]|uniref:Uncharacterized protein n=1 Tax=Scomber scombrus TaxID=13677 RepID=A0AAV1PUA7_SCOSC
MSKEEIDGEDQSRSGGGDEDLTAGREGAGAERMQEEEEQDVEEQDEDGETVMDTDGRREGNGDRQRRVERERRRSQRDGEKSGVRMEEKGGLGMCGGVGVGQSGMEWEVSDVTVSEDDSMEKVGEVRKRPKTQRHRKRLEKVKKKAAK